MSCMEVCTTAAPLTQPCTCNAGWLCPSVAATPQRWASPQTMLQKQMLLSCSTSSAKPLWSSKSRHPLRHRPQAAVSSMRLANSSICLASLPSMLIVPIITHTACEPQALCQMQAAAHVLLFVRMTALKDSKTGTLASIADM